MRELPPADPFPVDVTFPVVVIVPPVVAGAPVVAWASASDTVSRKPGA